jgi:hypothetical protein
MTSAFHSLVALLMLLFAPGVVGAGVLDGTAASEPPQLQLVGFNAVQAEEVMKAVGLFEEAGLVLPRLVITGSRDMQQCGGHPGLFRPHDDSSEVLICTPETSNWQRHVVLHELGHAWSKLNLTPESKAAFQAVRHYRYWQDYERATWAQNGIEQAAEIIAWGLNDQPAPKLGIDHSSCAELRTGYIALTGAEPLNGLTSQCDPPRRRFS